MGEFFRFGRQNVYNTHETEIAEISRLGSEEYLKFSPFTKSVNLGFFCVYPSHITTKDTKLDSYKKQKMEDLGVQQVGFQDPSCRSGAEARSIHPTKNLWASTTHPLSAPNGPARSAMNTQQHPQEPPGEAVLTCLPHSPASMLILHPVSVLPFRSLLHIGLLNWSCFLGSTLGTLERFSHFLAFSSSSFSRSRHPQMIPQLVWLPRIQ